MSDPYWKRVLVALDDFFGVVFGGLVGETISARAGEARRNHGRAWACVLCWLLDRIDANHCNEAIFNDCKRARAVLKELTERIEARYGVKAL